LTQGRNECRDDRPHHSFHRRNVSGVKNALAGGGAFITLPSLRIGMDARAANITSIVALFPAQFATGFTGPTDAGSPTGLTVRTLFVISLIGGGLGALISPRHAAVDLRLPRAMAGAVRDRALGLRMRERSNER
jgi:uncharacterized membrane protein YfcA